MKPLLALFVLSTLLVTHASTVHAQWIPDGTPIAVVFLSAFSPFSVSDGAGGAIIFWIDDRNGSYDVFAQRVDGSGVPLWAPNGVAICTERENQLGPVAIPDGAGGAIVAWSDERSLSARDIYVQRVSATGFPLWAANGVPLCTAVDEQTNPKIVSDGAGGAIAAWQDARTGTNWDIYARRINFAGVPQWAADGVAICSLPNGQTDPEPVADGVGGVIVAWDDNRAGNVDVYAQRVNGSGAPQWVVNGVPVCTASDTQGASGIASDNAGGAIIAWDDHRSGPTRDMYAQRIDSGGSPLWTLDGLPLSTAGDEQANADVVSDGAGGAIVAWQDGRNGIDINIYAQRINSLGAVVWTHDGVALCTAAGHQQPPRLISDGAGGAIATWEDPRSGNADVFAQKINAAGVPLWWTDGMPLCAASGSQTPGVGAPDGSGGVITAWSDARSGSPQVYAQRAEPRYGYWGRPEPLIGSAVDNPNDQGGKVIVRWTASQLDHFSYPGVTHYSLWRSTDVVALAAAKSSAAQATVVTDPRAIARDFSGVAIWEETTSNGPAYWEWIANLDASYQAKYSYTAPTRQDSTFLNPATTYFKVLAHESQFPPSRIWESATASARSVDNVAPAAPLLLTIQAAGSNAVLSWKPVGDIDLSKYTLYRAGAGGVQPLPINFLIDATLPNYTDVGAAAGGYYYIVTATDAHGNESGPSNEVSLSGSTDVGHTPPITSLMVRQNSPNPFADRTELSVGLPDEAEVSLEVFDIAGRRVVSRSLGTLAKGWQKVALDASDADGRPLASGVYFYRVMSSGTTVSRKMVIAR